MSATAVSQATSYKKPDTSAGVPANEDSAYAGLNSGDKRLVTTTIDTNLKKRNFESEERYNESVTGLRAYFSLPANLKNLKSQGVETGQSIYLTGKPYNPGYAR